MTRVANAALNGHTHHMEPPSTCLFVGDLSHEVSEEVLTKQFGQHGHVLSAIVKRDKSTGKNLGYGFVDMKTAEEARRALGALDGTLLGSRRVRISWATKPARLFVGDLDCTVTTPQLRKSFGAFGPLVEKDTFVYTVDNKPGSFGYVRFRHRGDAERLIAAGHRINGHTLRVLWADNLEPACIYINFNPKEATDKGLKENHLHTHFGKEGAPRSVKLLRASDGSLKGFGFIRYPRTAEGQHLAERGVSALNGSRVLGVSIKCAFGRRRAEQTDSLDVLSARVPQTAPARLRRLQAPSHQYRSPPLVYSPPHELSPHAQLRTLDPRMVVPAPNPSVPALPYGYVWMQTSPQQQVPMFVDLMGMPAQATWGTYPELYSFTHGNM